MVDEKKNNIDEDENGKEKYLKFGRDKRIVFATRDMWIEEYREFETENKRTKEKKLRKGWFRITGYCNRVKHLLDAYERAEFLTHHGDLSEYKRVSSDIRDAIDKIPDWLITTYHVTPVVIVQEKKIYISEEDIRKERESKLRETGIDIIKVETQKKQKPKTKVKTNKKKVVTKASQTEIF